MKTQLSLVIISLLLMNNCNNKSESSLSVSQIRCNGFTNPIGINKIPEFNWILKSARRGSVQKAYQIIVSSDTVNIRKNKGNIWDTEKIVSEKSAWISYEGTKLSSGSRYFWKVRVWDENDKPSSWSTAGEFVTGLSDKNEWSGAKWIGYEEISY